MTMIDRFCKLLWLSIAALSLFLFAGLQSAVANDNHALRTTDYFINHTSGEPFYGQNNLDPNVILHVREVILAGRERTVAKANKVLLMIHGGTFPGYVAFDLDFKNISMMRHFAKLGWDTFALDLEGYGLSTRPPVMDAPEAFPDSKAPMSPEVTVADVARVVDFIRDLRGVEKVHLLGWSGGAMVEAPLYTIKEPNKVAKLILWGTNYLGFGRSVEENKKRAEKRHAQKIRYGTPSSVKRWARLGTKEEFLLPGAFDAYREAHLASDPKSGELGGRIRAPWGRSIGRDATNPHFDASKIIVPILVIRGDSDKIGTREDNQALMEALGSEVKEYVEIPNAGHMLQFEKTNTQFYKALQDFLEAKK